MFNCGSFSNSGLACEVVLQDAVASEIDNLEIYKSPAHERLLFLSDGFDFSKREKDGKEAEPKNPFLRWIMRAIGSLNEGSLGERVAKKYPGKTVFRTDLLVSNPTKFENQQTLAVDNTKPFPVELTKENFDFIVMRDGLCVCCSSGACGGLAYEKNVMTDFISQVSSLINKRNPEAIAVLHARAGRINRAQLKILKEAADAAQVDHPELRYYINTIGGGKFHSLMIRPANAPAMSEVMNTLIEANAAVPYE